MRLFWSVVGDISQLRYKLLKLRRYGIEGRTIDWLGNYLHHRSQAVVIAGRRSGEAPVNSGAPQGGVLSGTLFNLFINDLVEQIKYCRISIYADDTKLFAQIPDTEAIAQVQEDINRMVAWCSKWRLRLNEEKCLLLQYNPMSSARSYNPVFKINDHILEQKETCKDLSISSFPEI